ncbi:MAG: polysaccharide deacetylase family protein [Rhodobacteraceae bacterium]|nr:polysaccharide deacetylase family protein [Paracoccaceae bacterium]
MNNVVRIDASMTILVMAFLSFVLLVPKNEVRLAAGDAPGAIVTFTFDDASRSQYEVGLRIASFYGVEGTIFVNTKYVDDATSGTDDWAMTWDEVQEFRNAGWEIGSHGYTHEQLSTLSDADVREELDRAKADIELHTSAVPASFAAPFGDTEGNVLELVAERHAYNVMAWSENFGRNSIRDIDPLRIERMEVTRDHDSEYICGEMINAAQNHEWLVLLFHEIVEGDPEEYQISEAMFEKIISCARYLERSNLIRLDTVKGAMQTITAGM